MKPFQESRLLTNPSRQKKKIMRKLLETEEKIFHFLATHLRIHALMQIWPNLLRQTKLTGLMTRKQS